MEDKHLIYRGIKNLIYKYHLVFKSHEDYQDFINELTLLLKI